MLSFEEKKELIKKSEEANKILEDYSVQFRYAKYTLDSSKPLKPELVCSPSKLAEARKKTARISLELLEGEDGKQMVVFYISGINFDASSFSDSFEKMECVSKALKDVKKLNELGLWLRKDLISLY